MLPVRLTDWNAILGTMLVSLLLFFLSAYSFIDPSFVEGRGVIAKLLVYVGPFLAVWALHRLVLYVEVGDMIIFRRLLTKRSYDWRQVMDVSLEAETTRYYLVPVTNEYLRFQLRSDDVVHSHCYRVSRVHRAILIKSLAVHAPQLSRRR